MVGNALTQTGHVAVGHRVGRPLLVGLGQALVLLQLLAHQPLRLAHGKAALHHQVGHEDLLGPVQREQGAGVAHLDVTGQQHGLNRVGQVQQTQQVGGGAAGAADGLGGLLVGVVELVDETLNGAGFFQRVQVLALDVLDQGQGQRVLVADFLDDDRHRLELGERSGTEAPFAGDDLVAPIVDRADHQGLQQTMLMDRVRQLLQGGFVHAGTGLIAPGLQQVQGHLADAFLGGGCRADGDRGRLGGNRGRGLVQHRAVAPQQ